LRALAIALSFASSAGCDDSAKRPAPLITATGTTEAGAQSTVPTRRTAAPTAAPTGVPLSGLLTEEGFRAAYEQQDGGLAVGHGSVVPLGATGYLSLPAEPTPPMAGVVLVHDRAGLTAGVRLWTDRFAASGFAALAVDLYDGRLPTEPEEVQKMAEDLEPQAALSRLREALRYLRREGRVRAERIGLIGWGSGTTWALRAALEQPDIAAIVLHDGQPTVDATRLAALESPLLALFGTKDSHEAARQTNRFEMGLEQAGSKTYRVLRYDAAPGFHRPGSDSYDAKAAGEAWTAAREFLAEHLRVVGN
jgi:carboxymethylenebutenolidase